MWFVDLYKSYYLQIINLQLVIDFDRQCIYYSKWNTLLYTIQCFVHSLRQIIYSSVEITLYLLADFLLQYVTMFQSRDIVKNLVSL